MTDRLRTLCAGGDGAPLFLFHPGGQESEVYRPLARRIAPRVTVYGLDRLNGMDDLSAAAMQHLERIRLVAPAGPYRLAGWSMGGFLAWEAAAQLERAGERVEFVAAIDATHPVRVDLPAQAELDRRFQWLSTLVARDSGRPLQMPYQQLSALDDAGQIDALIETSRVSDWLLQKLRNEFRTWYLDSRVLERYLPGEYHGPFLLFRATDRQAARLDPRFDRADPTLGWDAAVRPIALPGNHFTVLKDPSLAIIARHLNAAIAAPSQEREYD